MLSLLLAVIYLSFISLGLPDSLLGSAWPSMYTGLSVPISYAGIISMLISVCTMLSSLFSHRVVGKLGTAKVTVISVGMTAVALFGFSISNAFWMLCLFAIPYGLGAGSVDAALNNFVAIHYKAKHMSWLHCFWGVGATLGPYIMGASLAGQMGWSGGYRTISIIQIVLTAILFFSLPLWKKKQEAATEEQVKPISLPLRKLLKLPLAKTTLIAFFCYCSIELVTGLWGSSFLVMTKGLAPETAAFFISLYYLGITIGRFLCGFLAMRLSDKTMVRIGQGAALLGVLLLVFFGQLAVMGIALVFIGLGCAPIFPSLLHQTPVKFGKESSQQMMGLQMACAYVGNTLSPLAAGFLLEQVSNNLFPFILLLFVLVMIWMVEQGNRKEKEQQ